MAPESSVQTILRLRAQGWKPARILSGLGHPGYGAAFAARVLARIEAGGVSAHQAVYGELDLQTAKLLAEIEAR